MVSLVGSGLGSEAAVSGAEKPPHIRAFVAIALSEELLRRVEHEQQGLASKLEGVRWVAREQLHLTLKFYGNVATADLEALKEAVQRATAGIRSFELSLGELGCFPSLQRPSVLWLGLGGQLESLRLLQEQIERETKQFGSHSETRDFHPHLTIARVRDPRRARRVSEVVREVRIEELGKWTVKEVALIQSQLSPKGSTYITLAQAKLLG